MSIAVTRWDTFRFCCLKFFNSPGNEISKENVLNKGQYDAILKWVELHRSMQVNYAPLHSTGNSFNFYFESFLIKTLREKQSKFWMWVKIFQFSVWDWYCTKLIHLHPLLNLPSGSHSIPLHWLQLEIDWFVRFLFINEIFKKINSSQSLNS